MSNQANQANNVSVNIPATIECSTGARFPNGDGTNKTELATVSIFLDQITDKGKLQQITGFLMQQGLYAMAQRKKSLDQGKYSDPQQFRDSMKSISAEWIYKESTTERKRGRAAGDYPQSMRNLDIKILRESQQLLMNRQALLPLPAELENMGRRRELDKIQDADDKARMIIQTARAMANGEITDISGNDVSDSLKSYQIDAAHRLAEWLSDQLGIDLA